MKAELEPHDIEKIAQRVVELLKPLLADKKNLPKDMILDVEDLARELKVSKKWIYERTHLKEIPHIKKDGLLRFRKKEIDKWLDSDSIPAIKLLSRSLKLIEKSST